MFKLDCITLGSVHSHLVLDRILGFEDVRDRSNSSHSVQRLNRCELIKLLSRK